MPQVHGTHGAQVLERLRAAGAGKPLTAIQVWMGHAHISTTMIYAHYSPAKNEAAALGEAFSALSEPPVVALAS